MESAWNNARQIQAPSNVNYYQYHGQLYIHNKLININLRK